MQKTMPFINVQKKTIGIPRAMTYHEYGELWENFFKILGCNVIVSEDTNKKMLNDGVKYCCNESCLPVKVLHGHIMDLQDKVDFIFIPRYVSTEVNEITCPKFCGLPDMVKLNFKNKIKIIDIKIDINHGVEKTLQSLTVIATTLNIDYKIVLEAFKQTIINHLEKDSIITDFEFDHIEKNNKPSIAVLGHPYMIYDDYLSMNLIKKLIINDYNVLTSESLDNATKRNNAYPYKGRYFYGVGLENLGSAFTFAKRLNLKGIIYLTPFACGIDSLITEFIEIRLKNNYNIPWMKLTVDEHTGEAGFDTRLEAFLDMIG